MECDWMHVWKKGFLFALAAVLVGGGLGAQEKSTEKTLIEGGSTLAVKPMDGFEYYLLAALYKKHLSLDLMSDPQKASYVVEGSQASSRASTSKVFWLGTDAEHEEVSLNVNRTSDREQVIHDEYSRSLAGRGLQTMAETFANHLRDKVGPKPEGRPAILEHPKVYLAVKEEFRVALLEAFRTKQVPIQIVEHKDEANYVLEGDSQSTKADARRKVLMLNWQSREQAAIALVNPREERVVFAYAYYYDSSVHGQRSSAESCAKHLAEMLDEAKNSQLAEKKHSGAFGH
jgi:hypothetical protein